MKTESIKDICDPIDVSIALQTVYDALTSDVCDTSSALDTLMQIFIKQWTKKKFDSHKQLRTIPTERRDTETPDEYCEREKERARYLANLNVTESFGPQPYLLPCPFCEGEANLKPLTSFGQPGWRVQCSRCKCGTTPATEGHYMFFAGQRDIDVTLAEAKAHVIARWNSRVNKEG